MKESGFVKSTTNMPTKGIIGDTKYMKDSL